MRKVLLVILTAVALVSCSTTDDAIDCSEIEDIYVNYYSEQPYIRSVQAYKPEQFILVIVTKDLIVEREVSSLEPHISWEIGGLYCN